MQPRLLQMLWNGKKAQMQSSWTPNCHLLGPRCSRWGPREVQGRALCRTHGRFLRRGARHREDRRDASCTTRPRIASCHRLFSRTDLPNEACSEAAKKSYLIVNTISHTQSSRYFLREKCVSVFTVCGCTLNCVVISIHSLSTDNNFLRTLGCQIDMQRGFVSTDNFYQPVQHTEKTGHEDSAPSHPRASILPRDLLGRGRQPHAGPV